MTKSIERSKKEITLLNESLKPTNFLALKYLLQKKPQIITLNLGTGEGTSVLELIKTFQETNNVEVPFVFENRRDGDTSKLVADNSKAINILNWFPQNSLEEMCLDGWKWKCLNPNGYKD